MDKLKSKLLEEKTIAVFGLGNVGGPITASWLRAGANIIGVDISKKLLSEIKKGTSHKKEPFVSKTLCDAISKKKLKLTDDGISASKNSNIKIIIVPVALKNGKTDLRNIIKVTETISKNIKKNDVVILSPSVPPGTTEKIILPILEKGSGLIGEKDFLLIYNPERIFEGRAIQDIEENYPAIIAGLGKKSTIFGKNLLNLISKKGVITLPNLASAEAEKLFEGVYRDVNIALANQLSEYCEKIGINFWETRKASNSQPFCHLHYPGTGVGGLCIPVYPKIVLESSKKVGKELELLEFSRKINDEMPIKCVNSALKILKKKSKTLKGKKIAVLGLGFRGEVTDKRLSPTYHVVKQFLKNNCIVQVHDPFILTDDELPSTVKLSSDLIKVIKNSDLIFISTDHKSYKKLNQKIIKNAKSDVIIYDGRNILDKNNFKTEKIFTVGI
jgi:hypothetical protein